jgi:molybdate transport system substrate-binding protein
VLLIRWFCLFLIALSASHAVSASTPPTIRLFAAASLTDVVDAHVAAYHERFPDQHVVVSYAGSSTLAAQIQHGARADLFISADTDRVRVLAEQGRVKAASIRSLAAHKPIDIVWDKRQPPVSSGRVCMADPSHVPAGRYAKAALQHWGWWESLSPRLVLSDDVRGTLNRVARGHCSLGIVYHTDALSSARVARRATFPRHSHPPIVYQGALTTNASAEAVQLWDFFNSAESTALFARFGFSPVTPVEASTWD